MKWASLPPLVLDFDDSVNKLTDDEIRFPLQGWQESLRFGCSLSDFQRFEKYLKLPEKFGCVFLGSGDYHHISLTLLQRLAATGEQFEVIVLDNHPDNMRYPFGIHCGSWVYHASRLPCVSHIHVLGITSGDIGWLHAWENYLTPFLKKKLTYWSIGQDAGWLNYLGCKDSVKNFSNSDELLYFFSKFSFFSDKLNFERKIYLSIDKDVFAPSVVKTNWDQGLFEIKHLQELFQICAGKLIGVDVTGEVSQYSYKSSWKKFLSSLDKQPEIDSTQLKSWQEEQCSFNLKALAMLHES